ncbi:hypothetical protein GCM10011608_09160 [Micromonospora sonchi]|uniref:Uncharacterized protein n=1 Tax=Micromonospora sonchi TaxID=1763543 RepID=A0A917TMP7_9ACTN|nr:hypothetical protein [Micromonospora sonchi]GGM26553.1 hypothetical protein GCM10011608_09160 [Micromonospora sonchi]
MTIQVEHTGRKADAPPVVTLRTLDDFRNHPRPLPSWSDEAAWSDPGAVPAILAGEVWDGGWVPSGDYARPEPTRADLVATYGHRDPDRLAASFAPDVDVEVARRYAALDAHAVREVAA